MCVRRHEKYSLFLLNINENEFCRQIFEKSINIKLHANPSIGSRVVPGGDTDTRTVRRNEANTVVAFRDFANSLNESEDFTCCHQ